jgi:hypothetical protein
MPNGGGFSQTCVQEWRGIKLKKKKIILKEFI